MPDVPANLAYYRAVEGAWRCPLDLTITDWAAFRRAPMRRGERWGLVALLAVARLLGACRLDTSVDATRQPVVHTTRVSKWGVTLLRSQEWLALDANGRDVRMRVAMRSFPTLWRATEVTAVASVAADGRRADYRIPWLGVEMHQRGERGAGDATVTLVQETAFSRGVQVLRRRPAPVDIDARRG